jgi:hypothetical protein
MELLEEVSRRLSRGEYNRPDMIEKVAERFIEEQVVSDMTDSGNEAPVRTEKLDEAGENLNTNYYERPEVLYEIARKVLNIVHPSRSAGDGGVV